MTESQELTRAVLQQLKGEQRDLVVNKAAKGRLYLGGGYCNPQIGDS